MRIGGRSARAPERTEAHEIVDSAGRELVLGADEDEPRLRLARGAGQDKPLSQLRLQPEHLPRILHHDAHTEHIDHASLGDSDLVVPVIEIVDVVVGGLLINTDGVL